MLTVTKTKEFSRWFARLRDRTAQLRVAAWIAKVRSGNLGDVRPVGQGISEHRMHIGPGYRIYFMQREKAKAIAAKWEQRE
jgi:putative addiction module killer protein